MKRYSFIIFLLILLLPVSSYGTVDYLSVNHVTKEYYWGNEDNETGWIGWETVPEGQLDTAEEEFEELGYTRALNPFKIESILILAIGVSVFGIYFFERK
ncbi:hypothetical protein [Nafulsella turpanensis]|uniref:hypothetical protein n=1 Tax=Nafulsella turpanensis TaxID=1265690 RepID=UPI0003699758|nr:hypothetical protein [Nafulsella turpanensis]